MQLRFELCVHRDHRSLPGHFPGNPVVPGVLLLDEVVTQLERAIGRRVIALRQVKFVAMLRPDERAVAECVVSDDAVTFRAFRTDAQPTPLANGTLQLAAAAGSA